MGELDFIGARTDISVKARTVGMGAGLYFRGWFVVENGAAIEMFRNFIDAHSFAESRRRDLQGNDE